MNISRSCLIKKSRDFRGECGGGGCTKFQFDPSFLLNTVHRSSTLDTRSRRLQNCDYTPTFFGRANTPTRHFVYNEILYTTLLYRYESDFRPSEHVLFSPKRAMNLFEKVKIFPRRAPKLAAPARTVGPISCVFSHIIIYGGDRISCWRCSDSSGKNIMQRTVLEQNGQFVRTVFYF